MIATLSGCRSPSPARQDYWIRQLATARGDDLVRAVVRVTELSDTRAVPRLISFLYHRDPAVRFYAAQGLDKLTRHQETYLVFSPRREQLTAARAWIKWWRQAISPRGTP